MAIIRWREGAAPDPWWGRVVYCFDGDTCLAIGGPVGNVVRLYGIDAPEWGQAGASEACDELRLLTLFCPIGVRPVQRDRYGRITARILLHGATDVGLLLLQRGLVWWEHRFAPAEEEYKNAQQKARAQKIGLWQKQPYAFAPWVWRQRRRTSP